MNFHKLTEHTYYFDRLDNKDYPTIGLVVNENESFLIDAGCSFKHYDLIFKSLKENNLPYPKFGTITHHHYDHSFAMINWDTKFLVSKLTQNELIRLSSYKYSYSNLQEMILNGIETRSTAYYIYNEYHDNFNKLKIQTDNIIYDNLSNVHTITLGTKNPIDIMLISNINSPHSVDSTWIYILKDKVMFTGDSLYGDSYGILKNRTKENVHVFFNQLRQYNMEVLVESHNEIIKGNELINFEIDMNEEYVDNYLN